MRVLALGGPGGMGRHAVRTAVDLEFVKDVVVADLDAEAAAKFAATCGPRARGVGIDVEDRGALGSLLRDADVVLNTVGPFYRFGVSILRAAIDARCSYIDICDDWEPTLEMLALDSLAREAGVRAIVGLGASPGVSNLLAVEAMKVLDTAEEVVTGWGIGDVGGEGLASSESGERASREPSAALVHWLHQCSGTIQVFRDGRLTEVKPVQEVEIDYPGVGRAPAWTVGHPEAVTLPSVYSQIERSSNVMVAPRWLIGVLQQIGAEIDAGRITVEDGARLLSGPAPADTSRLSESEETPGVRLPPLFALARGVRDGSPARAAAMILGAPRGGMGGITGVPLALGLEFLREPATIEPGVFPPEAVIDPDRFFTALAPRCTPPLDGREKLVLVTTSG